MIDIIKERTKFQFNYFDWFFERTYEISSLLFQMVLYAVITQLISNFWRYTCKIKTAGWGNHTKWKWLECQIDKSIWSRRSCDWVTICNYRSYTYCTHGKWCTTTERCTTSTRIEKILTDFSRLILIELFLLIQLEKESL